MKFDKKSHVILERKSDKTLEMHSKCQFECLDKHSSYININKIKAD